MKINPASLNLSVADRFSALEEQEVVLELFSPTAREVKVVGEFNDWRPESTPLIKTKDGEWAVRLTLRAGEYEYRLVVDGQWIEDPDAVSTNPAFEYRRVLPGPAHEFYRLRGPQ